MSKPQRPQISQYARRILGLFFLANLMNFYNRQILSALAEAIKAEFALTDAQIGALNSAFELTYPLAAVTLAWIADRWSRQRIIALVIALWSAATALTGAANSYLALVLARLGVGVGQGGYGPPAVATLTEVFPGVYLARAVSIHEVGLMLGSAAGYLLGGLVAQALGWRVSFFLAGLPGLLLAWLVWRLRSARLASPRSASPFLVEPGSVASALRRLLAAPTLRLVYAGGVLVYLATGGLIFWLPTFMQRFHGYTLASAAAVGGAAQVVVGVLGVLTGGWLGDRLTQRHAGGRLLTMGLSLTVATPLAIVAILTPSRPLFLATAGLALFFYAFNTPCTGPQIHDVAPADFQATAQALYLLLTHYLGNLPSAPLIGWLSDSGHDLRSGMAVMPGVGLLAALLMLWGTRFAGRDAAAIRSPSRSQPTDQTFVVADPPGERTLSGDDA
jgi:MFS family permease